MATQPSANPKNLFAFLLGMLTLTQGLVLPTESLLLRRAAKPRSVTNSRKPRAIYGTIAESSVPRGSSPREPNPSFAPANSDVIQACGPFRSGRANLSASVPSKPLYALKRNAGAAWSSQIDGLHIYAAGLLLDSGLQMRCFSANENALTLTK